MSVFAWRLAVVHVCCCVLKEVGCCKCVYNTWRETGCYYRETLRAAEPRSLTADPWRFLPAAVCEASVNTHRHSQTDTHARTCKHILYIHTQTHTHIWKDTSMVLYV